MFESYKQCVNRALSGLGWGNAEDWIKYAVTASAVLFVLSIALAKGVWLLVFSAFSLLPLAAVYAVPLYFWESKQKAIEEELPQALYRAASNPFIPLEELVEDLAEGSSPLAKEFSRAARQVKNHVPVDQALENMAKASDSQLLKRALGLLLQGYRTGADMSDALRETAEEISGVAEVLREQAAATTIEKYTLLLAGGVIVPLVLGALISMVSSLDFTGLSELGFSSTEGVFENALLGTQLYIVEYAVLASLFVALQENSREKAFVYAAVLVPLSIALFMLAKAMAFA